MTYDPSSNPPPPGQYGQYPAPPPGGYQAPVAQGTPPPTHRAWSIVSIILGLILFGIIGLIVGIVATVYSGKVMPAFNAGDYAAAEKASRRAKGWSIAATVLEAIGLIVVIIALASHGSSTS